MNENITIEALCIAHLLTSSGMLPGPLKLQGTVLRGEAPHETAHFPVANKVILSYDLASCPLAVSVFLSSDAAHSFFLGALLLAALSSVSI